MATVHAINSTDSGKNTTSTLSSSTLNQLQELNIDSSKVKSEAGAKKLISDALKSKTVTDTIHTTTVATIDSEKLIMRDLKLLTKKINLGLKEELPIETILKRVYKKLKIMSLNPNMDSKELQALQKMQLEYVTIKTRHKTLKLKESGLLDSLEQTSNSNKLTLKL